MSLSRLLALSLLLFVAACPTANDDDSASNDDDAADPCADYEPSGAFDDMDDDEKRQFMTCVVMPDMTDAFQAFDADEYATFGCATCHGQDREAVDHEMPNGLEELPLAGFPFSESNDPEEAAFGEFMEDEVLPAMQAHLGRSSNFNDPNFFGCYGCHERP